MYPGVKKIIFRISSELHETSMKIYLVFGYPHRLKQINVKLNCKIQEVCEQRISWSLVESNIFKICDDVCHLVC